MVCAVAASRGAWLTFASPPPSEALPPTCSLVRRKKLPKSAIFNKFLDFCPLRIVFCPLDATTKKKKKKKKKNSGAATGTVLNRLSNIHVKPRHSKGVFINTLVGGLGKMEGGQKSFELPKGGLPKSFQQ